MSSIATHSVSETPAPSSWLRFSWMEFSGSLGDLGTFLPLVVGMSLTTGLDFGTVLIYAGLMNIVTGLWFGQPIPVQPMKAIAAVAITEKLTSGELAAAGIIMGAALLVLALSGMVERISRWIPVELVRGIQLGVGAKLVIDAAKMLGGVPALGVDSWMTAAIAAVLLGVAIWRRVPLLVLVFIAGFGLICLKDHAAYRDAHLGWPVMAWHWPQATEWWGGLTRAALPQLPLTMLNSVVAVCALSADLFPGRGIAPRRMAASVGVMNLISVPLGGAPLCHGAGGLAAQYRFGARTGGSVVMLGALKLIAGLAAGTTLLTVLAAYPKSLLAVLLAIAGLTLASAARPSLRGVAVIVVLATAIPIPFYSTTTGFLVGTAAAIILAGATRIYSTPPRTP